MLIYRKPFHLSLFLAICLSACAPIAPITSIAPTATPIARLTPEPFQATNVPATSAVAAQPAPLATSRGDQLEASDPALVKYGAGQPVLVEFFRFT